MSTSLGLEPDPWAYVGHLVLIFREVRRVLADDGTFWLNIGDSYATHDPGGWRQGEHLNPGGRQAAKGSGRNRAGTKAPGIAPKNVIGTPWRTAFALQNEDWILRNAIIWHKSNPMPTSVTDRMNNAYEHVFLLAKSRRYAFNLDAVKVPTTMQAPGNTVENRQQYGQATGTDAGGRRFGGNPTSTLLDIHETRNPGDVWTIPTQGFAEAHFACMPVALAERCVQAGCKPGGTVMDPFSGSGTTGLAAARHGRRYVGIDLNAEYLDMSLRTRLAQAGLPFGEMPA